MNSAVALENALGVATGGVSALAALSLVFWLVIRAEEPNGSWALLAFISWAAVGGRRVIRVTFLAVAVLFVPANLATPGLGWWQLPILVALGVAATAVVSWRAVPDTWVRVIATPLVGGAAGLGFWLGTVWYTGAP